MVFKSFCAAAWRLGASVALAGCLSSSSKAGPAIPENMVAVVDVKPLRQAAEAAHRHIGAAVMSFRLGNQKLAELLARHFDSLTPENEMKWQTVEPQPGVFNFAPGDRIVAFASEHDLRMRGHTLVWHSQLAPWVTDLSTDDLRSAMARHIENVVGHWKGKIAQ